MRLLDFSYPDPARNLALDEALLEGVALGAAPDTLRFWECPQRFVVIGSSQRLREEVHEFNCLRDGIPILRRCSAGGAVVQGPGCLNFAFTLSFERYPPVAELHTSYEFILNGILKALSLLKMHAERQGVSDLAIAGMKCSGNAQRRKRTACLHHGTLLYALDISSMQHYLNEPKDRPDYRGERTHAEFVQAAQATPQALRQAIQAIFCPGASEGALTEQEEAAVEQLAREKYNCRAWNYRR